MDARKITALHYAKGKGEPPFLDKRNPFWNEDRFREVVAARLADIPEAERKTFLGFLAHAPAKVKERAGRWDREKIPRSLHEIRSPVDELVWRLRLFVDCIDQGQVPTVEEYAANPDNKFEFLGTIIKVDQARSTESARGKQQEELDATVRVMHTYFKTVMGPFRCMRDNLIGDEVNGVIKAPEDNPQVSSVEAARLMLALRSLFAVHNALVDMEREATGRSIYTHLKIRGSVATGKVAIMRNDIRHTIICDLMNFAARMAGIPGEMELIVNGEAAKHLEPYFILEKVNVTGMVESKVSEYEEELAGMGETSGKELESEEGRSGLLRRIELNYRLFKLYEILYSIFELPNRKEGVEATETPFLDKMSAHRDRYHDLMDEYDLHGEKQLREGIKAMMRAVDDEYYAEAFNKVRRLHLKGFGIEAFQDLHKLNGYKTFAKDCKSIPANCRFRDIFLGEEGISADGRTMIEEFIDAVAEAHHIAPRADFNPGVILYLMTMMQLTGSPDFAYQKTCRAVGMALYAIDEIRRNWGNQPNLFLQNAQDGLVERGVFNGKGEIDEGKLSDYLAESVVLPGLLGEAGILRLGSNSNGAGDGAAHKKSTVSDLGQWLAKDRATFTLAEAPIKEAVMNLHRESAAFLKEINEKTNGEHGYQLFSDRTISIIGHLSYQKHWTDMADKLEPADALAAQILLTSGAIQSMRKLKAYKLNRGQKPIDWKTVKFELGKLKLHPYMLGLYSELFLEDGAAAA